MEEPPESYPRMDMVAPPSCSTQWRQLREQQPSGTVVPAAKNVLQKPPVSMKSRAEARVRCFFCRKEQSGTEPHTNYTKCLLEREADGCRTRRAPTRRWRGSISPSPSRRRSSGTSTTSATPLRISLTSSLSRSRADARASELHINVDATGLRSLCTPKHERLLRAIALPISGPQLYVMSTHAGSVTTCCVFLPLCARRATVGSNHCVFRHDDDSRVDVPMPRRKTTIVLNLYSVKPQRRCHYVQASFFRPHANRWPVGRGVTTTIHDLVSRRIRKNFIPVNGTPLWPQIQIVFCFHGHSASCIQEDASPAGNVEVSPERIYVLYV